MILLFTVDFQTAAWAFSALLLFKKSVWLWGWIGALFLVWR